MQMTRTAVVAIALGLVSACAGPTDKSQEGLGFATTEVAEALPLHPNETPELRALINTYADTYDIPRTLLHRVIIRESTHRPGARNGPYYGLMQILPQTAGTMGFTGQPVDLLDAETNLKYAGKYLRGAWLLSNGSEAEAVKWYARGYYYEAKRRGMLVETGLRKG
ncbi:lytic transglycosylase [Loktanella sp. 3ANDIMAR09]|uniref:lytic transglycosylase domain-containing protein n=1 Tax=Loktanella sp. 3ANDIMAR09 TaxID=1225657 RepID=UPI0006FF1265|nr:lytic transglycosylase domain-containing protein [Loktanella sp. 3ANDIMAR09]KQI69449.1 lytic transglycosylase [Loktanella sp. 3ANDIMAR09]